MRLSLSFLSPQDKKEVWLIPRYSDEKMTITWCLFKYMWMISYSDERIKVWWMNLQGSWQTSFKWAWIEMINFFLGLQVKQVPQGIFIHQEKYTTKLLKKFLMDNCSSAKVPIAFGYKISIDPTGESVDHKTYRGMIGSLMYLTAS